MRTRFLKVAAFALPLLAAGACAGESDEADAGMDAELPAPVDTGMYVPPPMPTPMDTGMMGMDTMGTDTLGSDTTRTN